MKKLFAGLKNVLRDIIDQAWTLLGMVVAWLVLEGSARDLVGNLILITLAIWIATYPLRNPKD
jgi:Na+-translocating ferredoxin:NAD+ oxidoreductase RnfE subunit